MAADSDADEIQRERQHRQAAERRRIDGERQRRRDELARLKSFDAGERESNAPRRSGATGSRPPPPPPPTATIPADRPPPSPIGAPIRAEAVRRFLAVDPAERFDIEALNVLPLSGMIASLADDPATLEDVSRRLHALMSRVKQEVDDPLSAGAFLRERVLEWYRHSTDPEWLAAASMRWAGLFADSRVSGGRLHPWLNLRLWSVRAEATSAGRFSGRLRRGLLRDRRGEQSISRTPSQTIQAEVSQALLDDLGTRPRDPEAPHPLVRLSELGVRRQVTTVNDTLALLFSSPENGPFVVLHPNRYPDCDELVIRPPAPGSAGAALAYSLVAGRPKGRGAVRLNLSSDGVAVAGSTHGEAAGPADPEGEIEASTIWDANSASSATWIRVVDERRRERRRLDAPPKDFRTRPAYAALHELILGNAEFRKALLAAKWRGRPTGLPLLVALLQKGRFAPEVATDYEYLEAELAEWVDDGPESRPAEGVWVVGEWTVRRDGSPGGVVAYRAERGGGTPPARP
jgi:hypothetical protein